jgi:hypothetical protein
LPSSEGNFSFTDVVQEAPLLFIRHREPSSDLFTGPKAAGAVQGLVDSAMAHARGRAGKWWLRVHVSIMDPNCFKFKTQLFLMIIQ